MTSRGRRRGFESRHIHHLRLHCATVCGRDQAISGPLRFSLARLGHGGVNRLGFRRCKPHGEEHRFIILCANRCIGSRKHVIAGRPNKDLVSTSHIEPQNLSVRMGNRRFTRLTNAFSKKIENHGHMMAIYAMHYNFCKIHGSLRVTPAMEAGLTDHVWTLEEFVGLIG